MLIPKSYGLTATALLLVFLASSARAIVIESGNIPLASGLPERTRTNLSGAWNFPLYNNSQGTLTSARVTIDFSMSGWFAEFNPYDPEYLLSPPWLDVRPTLQFRGSSIFNFGGDGYWFKNAEIYVSGPVTRLEYLESVSFSASTHLTISYLFTDPSDLSQFLGVGTGSLRTWATIYGDSWFGGAGGNATASATIIYGVPESGPGLTLCILVWLGLFGCHRYRSSEVLREVRASRRSVG